MEREVEPGDDAEVAAAAAQRPEEVGVSVLARHAHVAVHGDDLGGHEAVAGEAEPSDQEADAAAEGEPADTGRREGAAGHGEPVCLSRGVERPPDRAAACPRDTRLRIDVDLSEPREIDDQAAVADGVAGDVVPAASDGDRQLVLARDREGDCDVLRAPAARNRERAAVNQRVEGGPRLVVRRVLIGEDLPGEAARGRNGRECGRTHPAEPIPGMAVHTVSAWQRRATSVARTSPSGCRH